MWWKQNLKASQSIVLTIYSEVHSWRNGKAGYKSVKDSRGCVDYLSKVNAVSQFKELLSSAMNGENICPGGVWMNTKIQITLVACRAELKAYVWYVWPRLLLEIFTSDEGRKVKKKRMTKTETLHQQRKRKTDNKNNNNKYNDNNNDETITVLIVMLLLFH